MGRLGVLDISAWELRDDEPQGKNDKSWYRDPESGRDWLFKPAARKVGADSDGRDWAEKLAELFAVELEVPVAPIEFAVLEGTRGTICLSVNPDAHPIQSGSALLTATDPEFDPRAKDSDGHSLEAIGRALEDVAVPFTFGGPPELSSFDVFCGYLVLDALIANQDRHSQNWSVITADSKRHLMESYDHGSSLSAGLTDEHRVSLTIDAPRFQAFLRRGRASRFQGGRSQTLRDFASVALNMASPAAKQYWLARIIELDESRIEGIVADTPEMSAAAVTFVTKLVVAERKGLIDAIG